MADSVYKAAEEAGLSEEQKDKIMDAHYEEEREDRQRRRIDELENEIDALKKKVETLYKKVFDMDDDDADAIMSDVCKSRVW